MEIVVHGGVIVVARTRWFCSWVMMVAMMVGLLRFVLDWANFLIFLVCVY